MSRAKILYIKPMGVGPYIYIVSTVMVYMKTKRDREHLESREVGATKIWETTMDYDIFRRSYKDLHLLSI